jgi:hypothetical protein
MQYGYDFEDRLESDVYDIYDPVVMKPGKWDVVNFGYDDDETMESTQIVESVVSEEFHLVDPVVSMDISKKSIIVEVLTQAVLLEANDEVEVPAYSRQQIILSELSSSFVEALGITQIIFPPVGAEILTKKKLEGVVWNANGLLAVKQIGTLAYGVKIIDDDSEEAVVFSLFVGCDIRHFFWSADKLIRVTDSRNVELRLNKYRCLNYTNDDKTANYDNVPLCYTFFKVGVSYYIYIDGVPFYMPSAVFANLLVKDGYACSYEGKKMFSVEWEPGVYTVNMETHQYIKKTSRRADSFQQIQINLNSMVTTSYLLTMYPFLEGDAIPIPYPHSVEVVDRIDTRKSTCQVIQCLVSEMDNRKKIFLSQISLNNFESMMSSMSKVGVIVGNTRYAPFHGIFSHDVGIYHEEKYVRYRTGGDSIVIKGMKPHHLNGTWFCSRKRKYRMKPRNNGFTIEVVNGVNRIKEMPFMYTQSMACSQMITFPVDNLHSSSDADDEDNSSSYEQEKVIRSGVGD